MKIGIVVPEYRTDTGGNGGVAAVADFLMDALESVSHYQLDLISLRMSRSASQSQRLLRPRSWFAYPRVEERQSASPRTYDLGSHFAEFEFLRYRPRAIGDKQLSTYDCIIIVAGTPAPALVARRLSSPVILQVATMAKAERVSLIRGQPFASRIRARLATLLTNLQDKKALAVPDTIIVENRWMQKVAECNSAGRIIVCPPGIDTMAFNPGSLPFAERRGIVSVGRLAEPRKDYATLLKGYAYARQLGVVDQLTLLGRGRLPEHLKLLVEKLELEAHVSVLSNPSDTDLIQVLQTSRLFAASSTEEGLGIASIEAMACGVPLVATATEGAKYVLEGGRAGRLVPIGDAINLGKAIVDVLNAPDDLEESSRMARAEAERRFSAPRVGEVFRSEVAKLVGR